MMSIFFYCISYSFGLSFNKYEYEFIYIYNSIDKALIKV